MESPDFLTSQIITYIGNKRTLLENIAAEVSLIQKNLYGSCSSMGRLVCADLFSGSGIVSRMLKQFSRKIYANDLELYSRVTNECYLSNKGDFPKAEYESCKKIIEAECASRLRSFLSGNDSHCRKKKLPPDNNLKYAGLVSKNYAPLDDDNIQKGERVFYTRENALLIDLYRALIDEVVNDESVKKYFLAPLLAEASVHVNTSGVFKGFYKSKNTGLGSFGGDGKNALGRIMGRVSLKKPVFSDYDSETEIFQRDAVELASELKSLDLAYLDPPYNQHPYGSNYFMLNLIAENKIEGELSQVSGIPRNWNRSVFNRHKDALCALQKIVENLDAKYLILSYNSEGFISFEQMTGMLGSYGDVKTVQITYNTFRGSRNLKARDIHVKEYLFVLKKR